MSLVKFACTCDIPGCGARSSEYEAWPECAECGRDICPVHQVKDTLDEEKNSAVCHDCMNGAQP